MRPIPTAISTFPTSRVVATISADVSQLYCGSFGENRTKLVENFARKNETRRGCTSELASRRLEKPRAGPQGADDQRDSGQLNLILWLSCAEAVQTAWNMRDEAAANFRH